MCSDLLLPHLNVSAIKHTKSLNLHIVSKATKISKNSETINFISLTGRKYTYSKEA